MMRRVGRRGRIRFFRLGFRGCCLVDPFFIWFCLVRHSSVRCPLPSPPLPHAIILFVWWVQAVVLGVTGTGGAGKSSLIDELLHRFQFFNPERKLAIIALDPTKRKTGGALLGDRLRMNALSTSPNVCAWLSPVSHLIQTFHPE